jgi:predicted phosphodiesterase
MSSVFDEIEHPQLDDRDAIAHLEAKGFIVTRDVETERQVVLADRPEGSVRFGVVSDTHLGHKHQQLSYLQDFYAQAADFGAEFMLHGGDVVDGQNMHRDQQFELFRHGVDAQASYCIEKLPVLRRKKAALPTYAIGGNHDGSSWNDVGANVLRHVQEAREDFRFLGAPLATFHYGPLRIMLMHPDGGVAYARSYKLQKIVEQLAPDEKPHLLICGHWHTASHLPAYRNVEAFSAPCFQAQTAYMKRKGLAPAIGGILFEATFSGAGLLELQTRWVLYRNPRPHDWP